MSEPKAYPGFCIAAKPRHVFSCGGTMRSKMCVVMIEHAILESYDEIRKVTKTGNVTGSGHF